MSTKYLQGEKDAIIVRVRVCVRVYVRVRVGVQMNKCVYVYIYIYIHRHIPTHIHDVFKYSTLNLPNSIYDAKAMNLTR